MAIMSPDEPPIDRDTPGSEDLFWRELKEQLSDDFYVYHGLPYLTEDARQGEVDFLVLHPELGMMVIECKGWGVERAPNGNWYRFHPSGDREKLKKSPLEQARGQIEDIVKELREPAREVVEDWFRGFPIFYCWALAFPKTTRPKINLPLDLQPEVVIDSKAMSDDLEGAVVDAYKFHAQKFDGRVRTVSREEFDALRHSVISPPMVMPPTAAGQIELEKAQIARLTSEQAEVIRQLMVNRRLRVTGGAGTGKTVLATHGARMLAEEGKDVLLTCFNSALCDYLREVVAGWPEYPGSVDVYNFHKLCAQAGRDLEANLDYPDRDAPLEEQRAFWNETAPFAVVRALDKGVFSLGPWDAIVVDEAQDFAPMWWEVLEDCLRDEDEGQIAIFYDEDQVIFERDSHIPDYPAVFPLRYNFRNTKSIAEPVRKLGSGAMQLHPEAPPGSDPVVYQQPGPKKTRRMVGELLTKLLDRQDLEPDQIAILTPHTPKNSSLEAAEELDGNPIVHDASEWGEGVLHTSISSFKGLEADVVILVDIDPRDERCSINARYVAASRAVWGLHVFEKQHWLEGA
ncbi:MAG: NERD domain-containing protein [Persicimonas sp.]